MNASYSLTVVILVALILTLNSLWAKQHHPKSLQLETRTQLSQ